MSVKAMGLVWDLECPKQYGDFLFKASHKYCLLSYADHADHLGKNIFPSVPTIAKKMGVDDRTVQRLSSDLVEMGFLIEDGMGPRGTNRWKLPFSGSGDKLSPVTICRGDNSGRSLGDIPSGDIPSGDKLPPEFKEPEPIFIDGSEYSIQDIWEKVVKLIQPKGVTSTGYLESSRAVGFENGTLLVAASNQKALEWLIDRVKKSAERQLVGFFAREVSVEFVVAIDEPV